MAVLNGARRSVSGLGLVVLLCAWIAGQVWALRTHNAAVTGGADLGLLLLGPAAAVVVWRRLRAAQRAALARAHQQLEVMSSSADVLAWASDAEGNLTFAGPQLRGHFGYEQGELHGLNLRDVVHPQEYERLAAQFATGTGWRRERWRCLRKDGSEMWVSGSALPELSSDGQLRGFIGSTQPLGKDALDEQHMTLTAERIYDRLRTGNIVAVFQAIISTSTGRLIGAEALSRFPDSTRNPEQWFKDAAEVGLGPELELAAIRGSLQAASCLPADIYLSVNVSPTTLVHPGLRGALTSGRVALSRLVLEVTEHATIEDYDDVVGALADLRAHGVRVAVDDAGAGYASFRHILRLAPEFIKLDRSLIAGLDSDPALRALASAVVSFGAEMNSSIIAEGIETLAELRCAQTLGISAAQGYLFGRPTRSWDTWAEWHRRGPLISVHAADPRRVS